MLTNTLSNGIFIKNLEKRDLKAFFEFVEKGRSNFENWIPFVSNTTSLEIAKGKIDTYLELVRDGEAYFWCLWNGDTIIGLVLIKDIDTNARTAEIGYMIDKEHEGKGIIRESCKLMIDFLFNELKMNKIVLCCDEENEKSIGLAKRFGFSLEGLLRENILINKKLRNTMCWALFNENTRQESL